MKWRRDAIEIMQKLYPLDYAEGWDNVGVLVDSPDKGKAMAEIALITNDLTELVLEEALDSGASLIITYHPTPFHSFKKLTMDTAAARIILKCVQAGVIVYSPHTACDIAFGGVNDWLAEGFPGTVTPVEARTDNAVAGSGRVIELSRAMSVRDVIDATKKHLGLQYLRVSLAHDLMGGREGGGMDKAGVVKCVAVQAGAGSSVLSKCKTAQVWVTGEMSHHEVLAAAADNVTVILAEHTNTERGFLPRMAEKVSNELKKRGREADILVSKVDADPLNIM